MDFTHVSTYPIQSLLHADQYDEDTSSIHEESFKFGSDTVTLVDTPGFADTDTSDTDILAMIATWMEESYKDETLLSGIIYLHPINHNRMDGPSTQNIRMFRKLCGERSMRNVILATTMWHDEEPSVRLEEREQGLKDDFWKDMINSGSKVFRYTNTKRSAASIIPELVGNEPEKLDIQVELVEEGKDLVDTGAGACVNADLEKIKAKHEQELSFIQEEMEDLALGKKLRDLPLEERMLKRGRQRGSETRTHPTCRKIRQDLCQDEEGGARYAGVTQARDKRTSQQARRKPDAASKPGSCTQTSSS